MLDGIVGFRVRVDCVGRVSYAGFPGLWVFGFDLCFSGFLILVWVYFLL